MDGAARPVGPDELDALIARIRADAPGSRAGLFGPASPLWRVDREAALFLGAGRALLLQLAHPWVAAGIAQHSRTLDDPLGRFHRTFETMYTLVFGDVEGASTAARRLHRRHGAIRGVLPAEAGHFPAGSAYLANEVSALQWVHATLIDSALLAHDLVLPPLSDPEREAYYAEARRLGALFAISPEEQPPDWGAFMTYMAAMPESDALAVSPATRALAERVLAGAGSRLRAPVWYRALTAHLLPRTLRAAYDLPYGLPERAMAASVILRLRAVYPWLPGRVRFVGPYHEALGRLAGRDRPDPVTRWLNRAWIGRDSLDRGG